MIRTLSILESVNRNKPYLVMKRYDIVQDQTKRNEWTIYIHGEDVEIATLTIHDDTELERLLKLFNV